MGRLFSSTAVRPYFGFLRFQLGSRLIWTPDRAKAVSSHRTPKAQLQKAKAGRAAGLASLARDNRFQFNVVVRLERCVTRVWPGTHRANNRPHGSRRRVDVPPPAFLKRSPARFFGRHAGAPVTRLTPALCPVRPSRAMGAHRKYPILIPTPASGCCPRALRPPVRAHLCAAAFKAVAFR